MLLGLGGWSLTGPLTQNFLKSGSSFLQSIAAEVFRTDSREAPYLALATAVLPKDHLQLGSLAGGFLNIGGPSSPPLASPGLFGTIEWDAPTLAIQLFTAWNCTVLAIRCRALWQEHRGSTKV